MPQTAIVYTVINQTVATVDDAGLIEARVPGNTTVTGKVCYTLYYFSQVVTV